MCPPPTAPVSNEEALQNHIQPRISQDASELVGQGRPTCPGAMPISLPPPLPGLAETRWDLRHSSTPSPLPPTPPNSSPAPFSSSCSSQGSGDGKGAVGRWEASALTNLLLKVSTPVGHMDGLALATAIQHLLQGSRYKLEEKNVDKLFGRLYEVGQERKAGRQSLRCGYN